MTNQTRRKSSEFELWRYDYLLDSIFNDEIAVYEPLSDTSEVTNQYLNDVIYFSAHIANQAILNMMK